MVTSKVVQKTPHSRLKLVFHDNVQKVVDPYPDEKYMQKRPASATGLAFSIMYS